MKKRLSKIAVHLYPDGGAVNEIYVGGGASSADYADPKFAILDAIKTLVDELAEHYKPKEIEEVPH